MCAEYIIYTVIVVGNGALHLYRNGSYHSSYTSGIVEIYMNYWGNIECDESFGNNEANVICHQLSFLGVSSFGKAGNASNL